MARIASVLVVEIFDQERGRPEIFNTDQRSQLTSPRLTDVLEKAGIKIGMDGRGR